MLLRLVRLWLLRLRLLLRLLLLLLLRLLLVLLRLLLLLLMLVLLLRLRLLLCFGLLAAAVLVLRVVAAIVVATVVVAATTVVTVIAIAAIAAIFAASLRFGLHRLRGRCRAACEHRFQPADETTAGGHRLRHCHRCRNDRLRFGHRLGFAQRCGLRRLHIGHHRGRRDVELGLGQRDRRQLARGTALVAGARGFLAEFVLADAGDFVVRSVQLLVGDDHDRRIVAAFDFAQGIALFVEQEVGDLHRGLHQHLPGVVLHRVLLGNADDRQRQRLDAAHAAVAFAARADDLAGLAQRRAQALAAHLHQA
ncbi:MAG: hypothetical protein E6Q81_02615, partial [Thermomonas sp.]